MEEVPVGSGNPVRGGFTGLSCTLLGLAPSAVGSKAKCEQQHCGSKGSPGLPWAWLRLGGLSPGGGCDASGPVEWEWPPREGARGFPGVCVNSVAGSMHRYHAALSPLGSQIRKELTRLIGTAHQYCPQL